MIAFINDHRHVYGVEPICRVLPIAPSTYHAHVAPRQDPSRRSARSRRDEALCREIERVWHNNFSVYGVRKVWRQLLRESFEVARCTVARLMRRLGLRGVVRGEAVKTTVSDPATPCPRDKVNRQFQAERPDQLWVADFTYAASRRGFVYVAFVIDAFARKIIGWRVSKTANTPFVLDALEQAIHERAPFENGSPVDHSDRGSQYLSIKYIERLANEKIGLSIDSVGDSFDNALTKTVIGLFKTEAIRRLGPWRNVDEVEVATLEWVDWFNNRRLLERLGYATPAETEARFRAAIAAPNTAA